MKSREIAVFDSGVGGLTVYEAIRRELPSEDLVYLGDTARVPYGTKSKEAVTRYSLEIARFLEKRGIKLLVAACNTASSLALDALERSCSVPVLGVIAPAARAAAAESGRSIGIIGTEATVLSGAYLRELKRCGAKGRIISKACPLFVPLVEEGWWNHPVTAAVAQRYLSPFRKTKIDVLILGCTHYPMLKPLLKKYLGPKTKLIDSARETAIEARRVLAAAGVLKRAGRGRETFFATDGVDRFERLARRFLGRSAVTPTLARLS